MTQELHGYRVAITSFPAVESDKMREQVVVESRLDYATRTHYCRQGAGRKPVNLKPQTSNIKTKVLT